MPTAFSWPRQLVSSVGVFLGIMIALLIIDGMEFSTSLLIGGVVGVVVYNLVVYGSLLIRRRRERFDSGAINDRKTV